jgi:hypothetical protein
LVQDAMYFLSREWKRDRQVIDLTNVARFAEYLSNRIGTEGLIPEPAKQDASGQAAAFDTQRMEVPEATRDLLLAWVRELAEMLADAELYAARLEAWSPDRARRVSGAVRDTLRLGVGPSLLRKVGDQKFAWNYDRAGILLVAPEPAPKSGRPEIAHAMPVESDIAFIRAFATALAAI